MVTYLAIIFVIFLLAAVFYGFGIVMRRPPTDQERLSEKCSVCRKSYPRESLVERPIGDHAVLWFCGSCIEDLANEARQ